MRLIEAVIEYDDGNRLLYVRIPNSTPRIIRTLHTEASIDINETGEIVGIELNDYKLAENVQEYEKAELEDAELEDEEIKGEC